VNFYFRYPVVSDRPFLPGIECLSLGRRTIAKQILAWQGLSAELAQIPLACVDSD
ncbi:hypothetical protein ACFDR9_005656, partial [Janthinobacterium sp. CG_23.3]